MKRNKLIVLLLLVISLSDLILAQTQPMDSLLAHYPIQIGNAWDYYGDRSFSQIYSFPLLRFITATKDSIAQNGKKYIVLESVTYDSGLRFDCEQLGEILKKTELHRIDSTSLNVYKIDPWEEPAYGDELLIDSLLAQEGDWIVINDPLHTLLSLFRLENIVVFGEQRERRTMGASSIQGYTFKTTQGLGQTSWQGGEGEIATFELQSAVINQDTLGSLLRVRSPDLAASADELVFSINRPRHRIVFRNAGDGLAIVDSVSAEKEFLFFTEPSHPQIHEIVCDELFAKGPFLIFPADSMYLDIYLREATMRKDFQDTLRIHASSATHEPLPTIDIPLRFGPLVSVKEPSHSTQNIPLTFELEAHPNPLYSQQHLTIAYGLNKTEDIEIHVYDVLGRQVRTVVRQKIPAGRHQLRWQPQGLASGIYFLSISNRNAQETVRIQILK